MYERRTDPVDPVFHVEQLHAASVQRLVPHGVHINKQPELVLCVVFFVVNVGCWCRPQRAEIPPPGFFSMFLASRPLLEILLGDPLIVILSFFQSMKGNFSVSGARGVGLLAEQQYCFQGASLRVDSYVDVAVCLFSVV